MKKLAAVLSIAHFLTFQEIYAERNDDHLDYHRKITQAEELIAGNLFQDALLVYQEVFDSYDFVFTRDYKVATQLAIYLGDNVRALKYLKLGILSGWTNKNIRQNKFLKSLRKSDEGRLIMTQYDSLHEAYGNSLNRKLAAEVYQMFRKDQKVALDALFKIGDKSQEKYAERKFAPHSEKQLARLNEILHDFGYPGEKLIGNGMWMSVILSHHVSITTEYTRKDTLYPVLKPRLFQAIQVGEMSPYEYAIIEDWYVAVKSQRKEAAYGYITTLREKDLLKSKILRQNIGMRSVETRNALVDIQHQTGMDFNLQGKGWVKGKIVIDK